MRLRGVALGLSMAGQSKLAERVLSGWRVCTCASSHLLLLNALHLRDQGLCFSRSIRQQEVYTWKP